MKSLPLAYNKDTQEDKENVFDSVHTAKISLQILKECLATTTFHTQNMRKMATKGHLSATDLADFLVRECGIPFRDSHHITGKVVAYAEKKGIDISTLTQQELQSIDSRIKDGASAVLDIESSMEARNSLGGTASAQTLAQIASLEAFITQAKSAME